MSGDAVPESGVWRIRKWLWTYQRQYGEVASSSVADDSRYDAGGVHLMY